MNIKAESERIARTLREIKEDMEMLALRIDAAMDDLKNVKTDEDAVAFDERFGDLGDGLKHIELF